MHSCRRTHANNEIVRSVNNTQGNELINCNQWVRAGGSLPGVEKYTVKNTHGITVYSNW